MSSIAPNKIIIKPVMTEASIYAQSNGKYSFWVSPSSTKSQISAAFLALFSIRPLAVNTLKLIGKVKTNWKTRTSTRTAGRKKAIISVPSKTKIDILSLSTKKK